MGVSRALVDRAHVQRTVGAGVKVDGRTLTAEQHEPEFRARLYYSNTSPEQRTDGRVRSPRTPQLMCALRALDGSPVVIRADDRVHVESEALGSAVWRVVGEAWPLRKRRKLVAYVVNVSRVEEGG